LTKDTCYYLELSLQTKHDVPMKGFCLYNQMILINSELYHIIIVKN